MANAQNISVKEIQRTVNRFNDAFRKIDWSNLVKVKNKKIKNK